MRILNLGKIQTVPKLDEKKAIETGAQASETNTYDKNDLLEHYFVKLQGVF